MDTPGKIRRRMLPTERVTQICLFLVAAMSLSGGAMQMYLGEPDTTPRLDNLHRFMAGIYMACGIISLWTGINIKRQNTLVFLIALGAILGGTGRLVSMYIVGIPEPHSLWLTYVLAEFIVPTIIVVCQLLTNKKLNRD